jgi:hypothetical protein
MPATNRGAAADRRFLHDDEARALQMLNEALGHDRSFHSVVRPLASAVRTIERRFIPGSYQRVLSSDRHRNGKPEAQAWNCGRLFFERNSEMFRKVALFMALGAGVSLTLANFAEAAVADLRNPLIF